MARERCTSWRAELRAMLRSWALVQGPVMLRTSGPAARRQELCTWTTHNNAEQHPSAAATHISTHAGGSLRQPIPLVREGHMSKQQQLVWTPLLFRQPENQALPQGPAAHTPAVAAMRSAFSAADIDCFQKQPDSACIPPPVAAMYSAFSAISCSALPTLLAVRAARRGLSPAAFSSSCRRLQAPCPRD